MSSKCDGYRCAASTLTDNVYPAITLTRYAELPACLSGEVCTNLLKAHIKRRPPVCTKVLTHHSTYALYSTAPPKAQCYLTAPDNLCFQIKYMGVVQVVNLSLCRMWLKGTCLPHHYRILTTSGLIFRQSN
ncbi:hypothetical protein CRM22_007250 [Opisthorchis felineus]|uniref:Uncharacterized protein n=1 Tax=Opisthorchis felineus TaxID=147828 RepID=A0A4V3SE13_OPIFE|nr:hypothetical protein CRM22_007250 [Opisthorchis felineus]